MGQTETIVEQNEAIMEQTDTMMEQTETIMGRNVINIAPRLQWKNHNGYCG
jgi:hypothetical protein